MTSTPPPQESLRVLLFGITWDPPGGLNRYLQGLRVGLERAGMRTRTLILGPATDAPSSVLVMGQASAPLPLRLWRYARSARREAAADPVVDAHFALFAWWPVRFGSLRGSPVVVHFHGPWSEESLSSSQGSMRSGALAKRWLERSLYGQAQRLIVLSEAFKQLLVDDYAVAPWRVAVLPPGVELDRFTPDRAGARSRLGMGDVPVVFTARRLVPRMGLDVLLEAWAELQSDGRRRQLLIAGEGPIDEDLARQVDELGLHGSVQLLGRISEEQLVDHYRAADVCVLPSVALEGFGLAVVEALACGTPVVVTAVGGLPEVVRDLDASLIVEPRDPTALAARLGTALAGDIPSTERCRAHAETFSWSRAAAANADVYRQARDERRGDALRSRRLRVVYLDHCAQLSGAEIALSRLLPALPDVDAHVVLGEHGPLVDALRQAGVSTRVLPIPAETRDVRRGAVRPGGLPWRSAVGAVGYTASIARHLRRLEPDLVHTNSLKSALYGTVAARLAGVPVVWHARDRVSEDYLPGPAVRLVRFVARRMATAVVANSQATLDTLRLPNGTAGPPRFVIGDPYLPPAVEAARGGSEEELTVGMVGRLAPWKGQHVFLAAFARARCTGRERAVLIGSPMFGEQAYEVELKRLVHEMGLESCVTFAGFRPDVASELAAFDVLVHASVLPEPFGQVLVEGMAAGLPVIASGAGGAAEIVRDDVDGLLHPPGDVDALADALDRLLTDPSLRRRLGDEARRAVARFEPAAVGPQVMDAYRAVVGRDDSPVRRGLAVGQPPP